MNCCRLHTSIGNNVFALSFTRCSQCFRNRTSECSLDAYTGGGSYICFLLHIYYIYFVVVVVLFLHISVAVVKMDDNYDGVSLRIRSANCIAFCPQTNALLQGT